MVTARFGQGLTLPPLFYIQTDMDGKKNETRGTKMVEKVANMTWKIHLDMENPHIRNHDTVLQGDSHQRSHTIHFVTIQLRRHINIFRLYVILFIINKCPSIHYYISLMSTTIYKLIILQSSGV